MGGCLDFVELGDVVQDRDEDDRQDVHVTAADLSSKISFLFLHFNETTNRPGVFTLCFILPDQKNSKTNYFFHQPTEFPKYDKKIVTNVIFSTAGALTILTPE